MPLSTGVSDPRQDSLNEQMRDVMAFAVRVGCYDAHEWLLRNFGPSRSEDEQEACPTCEGTGMQPSGGYTYAGARLYDGGSTCSGCGGEGK